MREGRQFAQKRFGAENGSLVTEHARERDEIFCNRLPRHDIALSYGDMLATTVIPGEDRSQRERAEGRG
jgi:hypothetical protein